MFNLGSDTDIIITAAVILIGFLAYRQLAGTQYFDPRKLWTLPFILAIWNFTNLQNKLNDQATLIGVIMFFGLGLGLGLLRGIFNRVDFDYRSQQLVAYGSVLGLLLWLIGLSVSISLRFIMSNTPFALIASPAVLLGVYVGWRGVWQWKYSNWMQSVRN